MSFNGVLQLKKIQVVYSNWGGSSQETRELLGSKQWAQWKEANPQVEVEATAKGNGHPYLRAHYAHGGTRTICVRRENPFEIIARANALRDSRGRPVRTWVERKRIVSSRPSIQGQWTPFFKFGEEPKTTVEFKDVGEKYPRPTYRVAKRRTKDFNPPFVPIEDYKLKYHTRKAELAASRAAAAIKYASPSL